MAGTRPPGILVNIGGLSQPPPFFFFNIYEGLLSSRPMRPKSDIRTKPPHGLPCLAVGAAERTMQESRLRRLLPYHQSAPRPPSGINPGPARRMPGEIHQAGRFTGESRVRFYRAAGYVPLYDNGGFSVKCTGISVGGVLFAVCLVESTQTVVFERGRY